MSTEPDDSEADRTAMLLRVFSSVAHDLRTPLACIIGSLETLECMKEKLSVVQRDALITTALIQAHQLDGFIAKMLDKAKP